MASDYSKKTNAELVEILKSRSLPHTGKKAELVARLQEDDNKAQPAPAAKVDAAEDVIDWEDDDVPSTEAGAAAVAAGGKGPVSDSAAVPKQPDINPATTDDAKVESNGKPAAPGEQEVSEAAPAAASEETKTTEAEKPAPDYSIGLPVTELEEEVKKRKARAAKFGITEDSKAAVAEAEKKLERAKRFGASVESQGVAEISKLDAALPDEKSRKRGRSDNEQGTRGGKRRDFSGRNQFRHRGRGGNRNQGLAQKNKNNNSGGSGSKKENGFSEKDKLAMEARKKRFSNA
ncbi:hypothetical protein EYZ11_008920 [Aspergillus tanneri]|uniref:SAP domain-containing protein n=1 Tax=Aspergillus tanneri TaxID=1220188 RepID=A0A4S3J9N4_9EURO|nr:uncharacterized protein ATNIH1004_008292 [Aspergillus tanneri]KAA8644094.1 hypothetical protein ATNIH1004_008292 [Aspergillus tanneri]THC91615.1 hypothetical protein EYZ11_008920 [Aspergillus tanneri]